MGTPLARSPLSDLQSRLADLMPRDQRRLQRRLDGVRRLKDPEARQAATGTLEAAVGEAEARLASRRAGVPEVTYPPSLPVSQKKDDILAAIRDHQVVIVAGETGSGKTTQIPKVCLELGRGVRGLIGHTQPRRIAARTVAERVAEELGTPLGGAVGWKVRFTDQVGDGTLVKLMTDGILLAEIQQDRMLSRYDTLIIDEAHERSLNVDFILGYLKQLLPRRPDLKVVITSATIDPGRFSRHFDDAPVIEVSGRTYPVEVRYRPLVADSDGDEDEAGERAGAGAGAAEDRDQVTAICDAVEELQAEGPGDILVFLSGEREIRDTADALGKLVASSRRMRDTEILPLYARLSSAEQHRVFQHHTGRRVVLATNVAETSLTVPGIKYVVDPGTARISRYSHRLKVQRLPIEAVSQASANQRKGRCGRVSEGICVRLYSEEDFLSRPEFTDPEILRTNLASVILQMTAIGLGDIAAFPFVEPPDRRNIKDGVQLLEELGAIDPKQTDRNRRLTPLGRKLAQLPVDPRLARMVVEADKNGCVREVMVIAAALSIQDPRERPSDKQQAADEKHRRFTAAGDGEASDFMAYLNLWEYLKENQKELSSNQFRKLCRTEFLNYLRVREWQDIFSQLRSTARNLGLAVNDAAPADARKVHVSLLAGLLSHIGLMDPEKREYLGARGARFSVFPGSSLFKKPPRWVMAAELVETSRLWGRVNARIEPEWAEQLAEHLVKRNHSEPHWEKDRGAVMAFEKVTLYGVPLVAARKVSYGRIDPEVSRELFIRHALVQGEWRTHHRFFHENRELLDEVEDLEHRARRRDILVDDETLFDFYDERVGRDVVSARHFDSWWKKTRQSEPDLLSFEKSMLINEQASGVSEDDYPDTWRQGGLEFPLSYQFEPGTEADGVTVHIPLPVLNQVTGDGFDWQIPGLREELVTALIRSLPKPIRRNLVPAPDVAREAVRRLAARAPDEESPEESSEEPPEEPLCDALARELLRLRGVVVPPEAWDLERVPDHLRITFRVVDGTDGKADGRSGSGGNRKKVAEDKDLGALKLRLKPRTRAAISSSAAARGIERKGLGSWTIGTLPRTFQEGGGVHGVKGFPALVDDGDSVAVRIFETEAEQLRAMWAGTRRLLLLNTNSPVKSIQGRLGNQAKLALSHSPHRGTAELFDDCVACAADSLMDECGGVAWDEEGFGKLRDHVRAELYAAAADTVVRTANVLAVAHRVDRRIKGTTSLALVPALTDVKRQVAGLVYPGFVTATGRRRLPDVLRYLKAVEHRLERLPNGPQRDRERMASVERMQEAYRREVDALPRGTPPGPELTRIRWMVEELRVSYFAQGLGTPYPVSDKRILKAIEQLPR